MSRPFGGADFGPKARWRPTETKFRDATKKIIICDPSVELLRRPTQLGRRGFLQLVSGVIPATFAVGRSRGETTRAPLPSHEHTYLQLFSVQYRAADARIPTKVHSGLTQGTQREVHDSRGRRWRCTGEGLKEEDASGTYRIWRGAEGLPVSGLTCVAAGPDGRIWIGTSEGLACLEPDAPPSRRWFYFWGRRYLPDNRVTAVSAEPGGAWIQTPAGFAQITFRPYTLTAKSAIFVERLQQRHSRYGLIADSQLLRPGDISSNRPAPSDNDGLWTSLYVAAECFRYAATAAPQALAFARTSLDALTRLVTITGIPGFPAKAYVRKGDYRTPDEEWHWTEDAKWQWKGGTTNDELVGHFFGYYVAYRLLTDPRDRRQVAAAAQSIATHLLDHGFKLVGPSGRVPQWSDYSPEYFQIREGQKERAGLALELLSHLKVAHYVTGAERFRHAYKHVAYDMNYVAYALGGLQELPSRPLTNYSDEELAFLALYPLLQLETEPRLLEKYRLLLDVLWQWTRAEQNPLWNMIYLACQPHVESRLKDEVLAETRDVLERIPMETICWTVKNSQRQDLLFSPFPDRDGRAQALLVIPPNERWVTKWNDNPFLLDGGDGGKTEDDGAFFLLPYWMGRYHGFL